VDLLGQNVNIEVLEQLKYTGCVIKETLRINPPVPGGFRVVLKTFQLNVSPFFFTDDLNTNLSI
jgi:cytochrome P450